MCHYSTLVNHIHPCCFCTLCHQVKTDRQRNRNYILNPLHYPTIFTKNGVTYKSYIYPAVFATDSVRTLSTWSQPTRLWLAARVFHALLKHPYNRNQHHQVTVTRVILSKKLLSRSADSLLLIHSHTLRPRPPACSHRRGRCMPRPAEGCSADSDLLNSESSSQSHRRYSCWSYENHWEKKTERNYWRATFEHCLFIL